LTIPYFEAIAMDWFWYIYAKVLSTELSELHNDGHQRSRRWSV